MSTISSTPILSPLRYPGGKRRLAGYIAKTLELNSMRPKLFVEPFAGGASVSLQLLAEDKVEQVALGERDPLVASFWKTVVHEPDWLIDAIQATELTLETWKLFRRSQPSDDRERALVCLFMNRTSFSGILNPSAGPIGGWSQTSEYKIDCRFPVQKICERIKQTATYADRILFIHEGDWTETIMKGESLGYGHQDMFFYFDPPFYYKADRLYRYCFEQEDHERLCEAVKALRANYILSYDPAEPILSLYTANGNGHKRVELLYSATPSAAQVRAQELIISNLSMLPHTTRLWSTSNERKRMSGYSLPTTRST